ncbi:MAG: universal stress protein, partial [Anaerolineae bacterium]
KPLKRYFAERARVHESARDRILIPVANSQTARGLANVAYVLSEASADTSICLLTVVPNPGARPPELKERVLSQLNLRRRLAVQQISDEARVRNAPLYTKVREADTIAQGILDEVNGNVKLVLMGWPGTLAPDQINSNPVKLVLQKARANVAVLLNRGLDNIKRILVPVGGGFHSRLAIRLAYEIGLPHNAEITVLQIVCDKCDGEEMEDRMLNLREVIEDSLGQMPPNIATRLVFADDILKGVVEESSRRPYDLIVIGASEQWLSRTQLFGEMTDEIAEQTRCSVLLARRNESAAIAWMRRQTHILPETAHSSEQAHAVHLAGQRQEPV